VPKVSKTGRGSNEKLDISCEYYLRLQAAWLAEAIQPTVKDSTTPVCVIYTPLTLYCQYTVKQYLAPKTIKPMRHVGSLSEEYMQYTLNHYFQPPNRIYIHGKASHLWIYLLCSSLEILL